MMRPLIILIAALIPSLAAAASPPPQPPAAPDDPRALFDEAMLAYGQGLKLLDEDRPVDSRPRFARAAALFQLLVDEHSVHSGEVLHNLGCAYHLSNDPGRAVLNLRRAQNALPLSGAVRANLEEARKKAGAAASSASPADITAELVLRRAAAILAVVPLPIRIALLAACNLILWSCLAARILRYRHPTGIAIGSWTAFTLLAAAAVLIPYEVDRRSIDAVVISPEAATHAGPDNELHGTGEAGTLRAGAEVRIVDRRTTADGATAWLKIRTPGGLEGWVRQGEVEPVAFR